MKHQIGWLALACLLMAGGSVAAELSRSAISIVPETGGAIANPERSLVRDGWRGVEVELGLSAPLPFRVSFLDQPPRLVVDLPGLDWAGMDGAAMTSDKVVGARFGDNRLSPGWSRMILTLDRGYALRAAAMDPAAGVLRIRLGPVSDDAFAAIARSGDPSGKSAPGPRRQTGDQPLTVVLDPGHGGGDPGAEHSGQHEADLVLAFAEELRDLLEAQGMNVVMTREADVFVPLETRIAIAHAAAPDLFMSLHADALAEGTATGATVYTLSASASDRASATLAERQDRDALISGVNLAGVDDQIGAVLMDLARVETRPRSDRLADLLVTAIGEGAGPLYKHPRREASFSVLRSPEVPSVLVELGYLSNAADFARIIDPVWRGQMAGAIASALVEWQAQDAGEALLLRR